MCSRFRLYGYCDAPIRTRPFVRSGPFYCEIEVEGTTHLDFTDDTIVLPILKWFGITGNIAGGRIIEITNVVALQFFDAYLRGAPKPRFDGEFPELRVEMNSLAAD